MATVICNVSTTTTAGQVSSCGVHNLRAGRVTTTTTTTMRNDAPNADPELEHLNVYVGAQTPGEMLGRVKERLAMCDGKPVMMNGKRQVLVEYMISASRDFFLRPGSDSKSINPDDIDTDKAKDYFKKAFEFLAAKHGKDNIVSFVMHFDEITPHAHFLIVPIVAKEAGVRMRKVIVGTNEETKKREYGLREFKTKESVVLSSRHFVGSRENLKQLQTDFHRDVGKPFGLSRGVESGKTNYKNVRKFYEDLNKPLNFDDLESLKAKAIDQDRAVQRSVALENENIRLRIKVERLDKLEKAIKRLEPEQQQAIIDLISVGVSALNDDEKKRKEKQAELVKKANRQPQDAVQDAVNAIFAKIPKDEQDKIKKLAGESQNESEIEDKNNDDRNRM